MSPRQGGGLLHSLSVGLQPPLLEDVFRVGLTWPILSSFCPGLIPISHDDLLSTRWRPESLARLMERSEQGIFNSSLHQNPIA